MWLSDRNPAKSASWKNIIVGRNGGQIEFAFSNNCMHEVTSGNMAFSGQSKTRVIKLALMLLTSDRYACKVENTVRLSPLTVFQCRRDPPHRERPTSPESRLVTRLGEHLDPRQLRLHSTLGLWPCDGCPSRHPQLAHGKYIAQSPLLQTLFFLTDRRA